MLTSVKYFRPFCVQSYYNSPVHARLRTNEQIFSNNKAKNYTILQPSFQKKMQKSWRDLQKSRRDLQKSRRDLQIPNYCLQLIVGKSAARLSLPAIFGGREIVASLEVVVEGGGSAETRRRYHLSNLHVGGLEQHTSILQTAAADKVGH